MKEDSFSGNQWKWAELDFSTEKAELQKLTAGYELPDRWINQAGQEKHNNIQMNRFISEREVIWGALVYEVKHNDENSQKIFHIHSQSNLIVDDGD